MELYIKVMFWLYVINVVLRAIFLYVNEYPRVVKTHSATDVISVIVGVCLAIWTYSLVWG